MYKRQTYYSGFEPEELGKTIYHCLVRSTSPREVMLTNEYGVDLLPANIDLSLAEFQLVTAPARERRITRIVNELREDYDFILIDCQPSLGLLTINALAAAEAVIVPVSCEYLSIRGTRACLLYTSSAKRWPKGPGALPCASSITIERGSRRMWKGSWV